MKKLSAIIQRAAVVFGCGICMLYVACLAAVFVCCMLLHVRIPIPEKECFLKYPVK